MKLYDEYHTINVYFINDFLNHSCNYCNIGKYLTVIVIESKKKFHILNKHIFYICENCMNDLKLELHQLLNNVIEFENEDYKSSCMCCSNFEAPTHRFLNQINTTKLHRSKGMKLCKDCAQLLKDKLEEV